MRSFKRSAEMYEKLRAEDITEAKFEKMYLHNTLFGEEDDELKRVINFAKSRGYKK